MATTNVSNLDGLDAVANIGAPGEVIVKDAVKKALSKLAQGDPRVLGLFEGQMAAEGFAVEAGIKYTVESPTVKVEVVAEGAQQNLIRTYIMIGSAWTKIGQQPQYVL